MRKNLPYSGFTLIRPLLRKNLVNVHGFTLIELLVVISIIAILSAVGLTSYGAFIKNSRDQKRLSDLKLIQSALEEYHADQFFYPTSAGMQSVLNSGGQFDNEVGNPTFVSGTTPRKIYLRSLPLEPISTLTQYRYEASKLSAWEFCDNSSTNKCGFYCLYANLENTTSAVDLSSCPVVSGGSYNFESTPP